jgi:hypothetical protein
MNNQVERRISERFQLSESVKFTHFYLKNVFRAQLINCSEEGVCFESDIGLQPGADVFIARSNDNKYFRAQVVWCKKLNDNVAFDYGTGAVYNDPVL